MYNIDSHNGILPTKDQASGSRQGVGLVQKTLQILDLFQLSAPVWTQVEISQETGLPKSTVNRLVRFLTHEGYLRTVEGRSGYSLGAMAIDLGKRADAMFDFPTICRPTLEALARETSETVVLTVIAEGGKIARCVDKIESTRDGLRVFEAIGATFALHAGAAPKAILAAMRDEDIRSYAARELGRVTDRTITDPKRLLEDITATRTRGYSISESETYEGVTGVGVPILWKWGCPAGSIAIAAPSARSDTDRMQVWGQMLIQAADALNRMLAPAGIPTGE